MNVVRCIELFSGIGGFAAACCSRFEVVGAIDINQLSQTVYTANFDHPTQCHSIESLHPDTLARFDAELWWMSPPCQPFTRRGLQRDLQDPRSAAFLNLLGCIGELQPKFIALENVPPFQQSGAAKRLRETLSRVGYRWIERIVSPVDIGIANRRARFYLLAARESNRIEERLGLPPVDPTTRLEPSTRLIRTVPDVLIDEASNRPELRITSEFWCSYREAMDVVDHNDPSAITSCFTSAYGRSPVHCGSYVRDSLGIRRFAPDEILQLLGFPNSYRMPETISVERQWRLIGNSLAVDVVKYLMQMIT